MFCFVLKISSETNRKAERKWFVKWNGDVSTLMLEHENKLFVWRIQFSVDPAVMNNSTFKLQNK